MLTKLGEDDLADVPQMEPVRNDMLQEAKTFYETFLRERTGDPRARRDVALSGVRLGDIETLLGHLPKAEVRYNDAIGHLNALLKERPKDRELRNDLSRALHSRGLLFRKQSRSGEAERDFKDAIDLRQALADEFPAELNYQRARADSLYHLAALHMLLGDNVKARREYQDVIGVLEKLTAGPSGTIEDRRLLARYTNNLANLLLNEKGDGPKEAKAGYQKALAIQQQVHDEKPAVAIYRSELAKTHGNLRFVLAGENKLKEAESHAREDLALSRKLAEDFKRTPDYRWKLAAAEISLGELRVGMRQFDEEAGKLLDDAVALADGLVKEHGDQRSYLSVLAQRGSTAGCSSARPSTFRRPRTTSAKPATLSGRSSRRRPFPKTPSTSPGRSTTSETFASSSAATTWRSPIKPKRSSSPTGSSPLVRTAATTGSCSPRRWSSAA